MSSAAHVIARENLSWLTDSSSQERLRYRISCRPSIHERIHQARDAPPEAASEQIRCNQGSEDAEEFVTSGKPSRKEEGSLIA